MAKNGRWKEAAARENMDAGSVETLDRLMWLSNDDRYGDYWDVLGEQVSLIWDSLPAAVYRTMTEAEKARFLYLRVDVALARVLDEAERLGVDGDEVLEDFEDREDPMGLLVEYHELAADDEFLKALGDYIRARREFERQRGRAEAFRELTEIYRVLDEL